MGALMSADASSVIAWGVSARSIPGETVSGDLHVVVTFPERALVGVIDGLGHGADAAAAARIAAHTIAAHAHDSVVPILTQCHEALRGTRGVVLSLAAFDGTDGTMTWLGVGNVEGVLFRADKTVVPAREGLLSRGGVVGYQLPPLRPVTIPIGLGDMLVLATDGIRSQFAEESPIGFDPEAAAQDIHAHYGKQTDDALVLVARYEGLPS